MFHLPSLEALIFIIPTVIISLAFHEFAHAWAAHRLGDNTAKNMGRLTLNPIPHIDPIGLLLITFAGFGWAKPVPVNVYNLAGDRNQSFLLVSLAGPASNLLLAFGAAIVFHLSWSGFLPFSIYDTIWESLLRYLVWINVLLAVFNMLPIPPLDGSRIFRLFIPERYMDPLETYGMFILIALMLLGLFGLVLVPIVSSITGILLPNYY